VRERIRLALVIIRSHVFERWKFANRVSTVFTSNFHRRLQRYGIPIELTSGAVTSMVGSPCRVDARVRTGLLQFLLTDHSSFFTKEVARVCSQASRTVALRLRVAGGTSAGESSAKRCRGAPRLAPELLRK